MKSFFALATVGQDIPAIKLGSLIIASWPTLWIGSVRQAVNKFGTVYWGKDTSKNWA